MTKIKYKDIRFRKETLSIIDIANNIIDDFLEQGYILTLRQLYYQFVARDLIPNQERWYQKLGNIVSNGRLAGLIDWKAITDRTRVIKSNSHWEDPGELIQTATDVFRMDSRITQDTYLEVWVEKDALIDVVGQVCKELDVPYFSCRGYVSQSAMWEAAQRIDSERCWNSEEIWIGKGMRNGIIIHLGDHDPSGINMTDDIQKRFNMFTIGVDVERIALTMDQVEEYNPPPQPAKVTDSRYESYTSIHGNESWELDALDPRIITELIRSTINRYTDDEKRQQIIDEQEEYREELQQIANRWEEE